MSDVRSRADFPEPRGLTDDVPKANKESKSRFDEPEDLVTCSGKGHRVDKAAAVQAAKKRRPVPSRAESVRDDAPVTAPIKIGEVSDVRSRADFPEPRGLTDDVPKAKKESKSRLDEPEDLGTCSGKEHSLDKAAVAVQAAKKRRPVPSRTGSVRDDAPVTAPIEIGEVSDVRSRADFPEPRGLTDNVPKAKKESKCRLDEPEDLGPIPADKKPRTHISEADTDTPLVQVISLLSFEHITDDVPKAKKVSFGHIIDDVPKAKKDCKSRLDEPEDLGRIPAAKESRTHIGDADTDTPLFQMISLLSFEHITDDVPKARKERKSRLDDPEDLCYMPAAKKPRTHTCEADTDTPLVQMISNPIRGVPKGVKSITPAPRRDREGKREMQSKWRKSAMYVACLLVLIGVIVGITVGVRNSRSGGDETPAPGPPPEIAIAVTVAPTSPTPAAPTMAPTTPNIFSRVDPLQEYLISVSPDGGAALQDPSTPQYAAFTWLSEEPNLSTYSDIQINQRYSLATLYFSTGGEDWSASNEWLGPQSECLWLGVKCRAARPTRRLRRRTQEVELVVRKVHLFELGLAGPLPPELVLMPDTLDLILYGNTITGSIPTFIGELSSLEVLELDGNQISGAIPLELYGLTSLTRIRLENNNLVGSIATEVGQLVALEKLRVDGNFISGAIPEEMGNLVSLEELRLNTNGLSGAVPESFESLIRVEEIYLHETSLVGSVPSSICSLINRDLKDLTSDCGGTDPAISCECCTECYPVEE